MDNRFIPTKTADGLRAAVEAISIDPRTFRMAHWYCGTHMCIAGHFNLLRGLRPSTNNFWFVDEAGELVRPMDQFFSECGVSVNAFSTNKELWLFFLDHWPRDLRALYRTDPVRAARLALEKYLDEFEVREDPGLQPPDSAVAAGEAVAEEVLAEEVVACA